MEKVEFALGPSKGFTVFLGFLYVGSMAIIFWVSIPYFLKIAGTVLLTLHVWQIWNLHGRRASKKAVVRIWQDSRGCWGCQTKQGHSAIGALKGDSFKNSWLLILYFRFRNRSLPVIVPVDSVNFIEYRVLSIRLNQHRFK